MSQKYNKAQVMYTRWRRVHQYDQSTRKAIPHQHNTRFMENCEKDVKRLKTVLGEIYHFSSTDYEIRRERNKFGCKVNPSASQVSDFIQKLAADLDKDDLFVFYYVGHGERPQGPATKLKFSGIKYDIEYDEIKNTLKSLPCDVLVILDCCQSGDVKDPATPNRLITPKASTEASSKFNFLGACMAYDSTTGEPQRTMTSFLATVLMEFKDHPTALFLIANEIDEKTKTAKMTGKGLQNVHYVSSETEGDITLAPI